MCVCVKNCTYTITYIGVAYLHHPIPQRRVGGRFGDAHFHVDDVDAVGPQDPVEGRFHLLGFLWGVCVLGDIYIVWVWVLVAAVWRGAIYTHTYTIHVFTFASAPGAHWSVLDKKSTTAWGKCGGGGGGCCGG